MSYRVIAACLLVFSLVFAGVGLIHAQTVKGKEDAKKEDKKEEKKDEGKTDEGKDEKKDDEKEEKYLTHHEAEETMEAMEKAWNKLKMNLKNKRGDVVAEQADIIADHAAKFRKYDGEVLTGDEKGKKARDQKDFKEWLDKLEEAAKEISKQANKSKWDKVDEAKEKAGDTCGACHDVYQPEEED
ncbi:MAG: cytochrome c [Planctomycetes bacterium]|nr:cytochrome c [Planctomycetota bacterium]